MGPARVNIPLGAFDLLAPLASGGMGQVWRGTHRRTGRAVAIKVITAERAHEPERVAAIVREVRAVAALTHPAIVTVYDSGVVDGLAARRAGGRLVEGSL